MLIQHGFRNIIIVLSLLLGAFTLPGVTMAACSELDYQVCDSINILSDKIKCRADVAAACNQNDKGISQGGFFAQSPLFDVNNFSLISWITFGINIGVVFLMAYWIFLVVKGALKVISSEGNPGEIEAGWKQIAAVFRSIAAIFIFLTIIIFAGNFLGFGAIWEWPRSFSQCSKQANKFYFTVKLEKQGEPFECN